MNIKTFIYDSEREFDRDIPQYAHNRSDRNGLKRDFLVSEVSKVKSFTSSKLRELIGEVRKMQKEEWDDFLKGFYDSSDITWKDVSVVVNKQLVTLQLLDEIK